MNEEALAHWGGEGGLLRQKQNLGGLAALYYYSEVVASGYSCCVRVAVTAEHWESTE